MMSNKGDDHQRITCPYNAAHQLLRHRVQTHLVKCRKNYPDAKIVTCMYNATHRVPEPELAFHHDNCGDRLGLDKFMFAPEPVNEERFRVPIVNVEPTEVWDDVEHPSYNPEEHCINNPILRKKDTLSKAKRKNFRWEERQRMQQFQNDTRDRVESERPNTTDVHPRRPHTLSKGVTSKADLVEDDVSNMLKKIHLGANVAIVPPKQTSNTPKPPENNNSNATESHFPQNTFSQIPHASGTQNRNGTKPKSVRGRGSMFHSN